MRTHLFFILLCFASYLRATNTKVATSTFNDACTAAADGDTLLLVDGNYGTNIIFLSRKAVTLKADANATPVIKFSVTTSDASIADTR